MIRFIFATTLAVALASAAQAQHTGSKGVGDPAKLEKCRQLAKQRGFNSGMEGAKTGSNMRSFVIACMQGKQN
jgi:hypothetical protein